MPLSSPSKKLRKNLDLKIYLDELEALMGRPVQANELSDINEAMAMRMTAREIDAEPSVVYEMSFSEKTSERFRGFLCNLANANSSSVYIWTPRTNNCGILLVSSLAAIRFDFDFSINSEGILAITTGDLCDSLLLDFSNTCTGDFAMKVEVQGGNWARVAY